MAFMVSMLAIVSLVSMVSMRFPWFSWFLWFWFLCLVFIMCVLVSWMCFKMILIRGVCVSKWSLSVCVSKWSLSGVSKWSGSRGGPSFHLVHRGGRLKCFNLNCDLGATLGTRGRILKRLGKWEVVLAITNVVSHESRLLGHVKVAISHGWNSLPTALAAELACRSHLHSWSSCSQYFRAKSAWNSCVMSHQFVFNRKEAEREHQPISFYLFQPFLFY